jgi:hypothetical protein
MKSCWCTYQTTLLFTSQPIIFATSSDHITQSHNLAARKIANAGDEIYCFTFRKTSRVKLQSRAADVEVYALFFCSSFSLLSQSQSSHRQKGEIVDRRLASEKSNIGIFLLYENKARGVEEKGVKTSKILLSFTSFFYLRFSI